MTSLETLFADYASYHRSPGNKVCHRVGIPLIMFSLLGMLALLHVRGTPASFNGATILIVLSSAYYLFLDLRLGLVMLLASIAMALVAVRLPLWLLMILFVAGWILQGIGHARYEKRAPAFTRNLVHFLVGPLWIASDAVAGIRTRRVST